MPGRPLRLVESPPAKPQAAMPAGGAIPSIEGWRELRIARSRALHPSSLGRAGLHAVPARPAR